MRKLVFIIAAIFLGVVLNAQNGELSIKVTGIDVKKGGTLKIGVYEREGFPYVGNQKAYKILDVVEAQSTVLFKDIEPGTYAVAVFQDADTNGVLSKNVLGMPLERYGFSRNNYGKGGPPNFDDVSFKLESGKRIVLVIELK